MQPIIREKGFYRDVFAIMIPIALQNLIVFGINMMDTVMLGAVGETQISASALANQPFFIFTLVVFGLAAGASVLASQYWGKGDIRTVKKVISIVVDTALVASVLFAVAAFIFAPQIMRFYTKEEAVILEGVKYMRIIAFSYFFYGTSNVFLTTLRSVETVKISVLVTLTSFATNVFLNWVLIFGHLGMPKLGIRGAAIATLIARICEFAITWIYAFFIDKKLRFRFRELFSFDLWLVKDYFRYSLPVVANEVIWSLATTMQSAVLGQISSQAVAANSINSVLSQLTTVFIFGIANASCVLIGKTIGEQKYDRARRMAFTFVLWSVVIGLAAGIITFLLRDVVVQFYNVPDATKQLASRLVVSNAFIVFFVSMSSLSIMGPLRAGGDTRFCLAMEMLSLWCFAVPAGAIAGLVLRWPVPIVYFILRSDEIIKAFFAITRILRNRWLRNVTRDVEPSTALPAE